MYYATALPTFTLRYEDLREDTVGTLREVLVFLGVYTLFYERMHVCM